MPSRVLFPLEAPLVTDWSGRLLAKAARHEIVPGCIVRAVLRNEESGGSEALYFDVKMVKDGSVWGLCRDTYRTGDSVGLRSGAGFSFSLRCVSEIPVSWQPRPVGLRLRRHFLAGPTKARPVTGVF